MSQENSSILPMLNEVLKERCDRLKELNNAAAAGAAAVIVERGHSVQQSAGLHIGQVIEGLFFHEEAMIRKFNEETVIESLHHEHSN